MGRAHCCVFYPYRYFWPHATVIGNHSTQVLAEVNERKIVTGNLHNTSQSDSDTLVDLLGKIAKGGYETATLGLVKRKTVDAHDILYYP